MALHRADKRALARRHPAVDSVGSKAVGSAPSTPGKRKAVKPRRRTAGPRYESGTQTESRKTLIPGFPSAPTLIGATAVALAAVGAVSAAPADGAAQVSSGTLQRLSAAAPAPRGAGEVVSAAALAGRERAVSRDSRREALQDVADERLQAAAEKQAEQRKAALAAVAADAARQAALIAKNAWDLPVSPRAYHLTSRFGECSGLWSNCHTGLDFAAPSGTPIRAAAQGKVTEVGSAGAYGNRTIVTLEDGTEQWYCHQTDYSVTVGQVVQAGEVIGSVGSTGNTTGPHLHFEVRPRGRAPVDPFTAFVAHDLHP